jgi:hypothetical protein
MSGAALLEKWEEERAPPTHLPIALCSRYKALNIKQTGVSVALFWPICGGLVQLAKRRLADPPPPTEMAQHCAPRKNTRVLYVSAPEGHREAGV